MSDFVAKFVKLDARHNLYHKGYRFAYRCVGYSKDRYALEAAVNQVEKAKMWHNTYIGKSIYDENGNYNGHIFWIGMKRESTHTMITLMKDYV